MRVFLALLLAFATAFAQPAATQPSDLFSRVDGMLASLSNITGWKVKRSIPHELLSKEKFTKLVEESAAEAERDKATRAAELAMKMFGLVPWDFNLARESADLLEEQAAAFYDYKKKRLFVLESTTSSSEQQVALAHELAHALADQNFNLRKFLDAAKDDEAVMAREAVIEGQASWLSWAYMSEQAGGRAEVPRALLDELALVGAAGEDYPVLANTPLYMRESLTFPYTAGMLFQDAVFRDAGRDAFTRIFTTPPLSTQEVMHPERYRLGTAPVRPPLPDPVPGVDKKRLRRLTMGDVGEFDFTVLLRQYAGEVLGPRVASHWRGGAYALYEEKQTKAPLLVHVSEWDSPAAARDFFLAYQEVMKGKWKQMEIHESAPDEITGHGDTGDFRLRISGTRVQCVEGIPAPRKVN